MTPEKARHEADRCAALQKRIQDVRRRSSERVRELQVRLSRE
jgi:hypothetical protein